MLHTWSSDNRFFERPTTPDGSNDTAAPDRPPAGTTVKVRDTSGNPLPDLTLDAGGLWSYSYDSEQTTLAIQLGWITAVDGEGNPTNVEWDDTVLWSKQSLDNMAASGASAAEALAASQTTDQRVDALADQIESGVAGVSKIVTPNSPDGLTGAVTLTAAELGARSTAAKVPAADIDGLAKVATSNLISDLTGYKSPIPLDQKGQPNGVPSLGADGKIPASFLPGGFGTVGSVAGVAPDGNGNVTKADLITALDVPTNTDLDDYTKTTDLADVATSGSYNDLTDKPGVLSDRVMYDGGWPTSRPAYDKPIQYDDTALAETQGSNTTGPPSSILNVGDYWWTKDYS